MIFGSKKQETPMGWRAGFAWLPVILKDGRWVWLEAIEVFTTGDERQDQGITYRYRLPAAKPGDGQFL